MKELKLSSSFVAANIDRTLKDFLWLEQALREEYHGSLLFPMLSLAVTSGADWTTAGTLDKESFERGEWDPVTISSEILEEAIYAEDPVDTKLLADWLSDVLNAVRGKGELLLNHLLVVHSEAMESFLFKTAEPLPNPRLGSLDYDDADKNWLGVNLSKALQFQESEQVGIQSTLQGLVMANLKCLGISDECELGTDSKDVSDILHMHQSDRILSRRNKIHEKQESPRKWEKLIPSHGLRAQRFYIAAQKENTLRAMYRLRILLEKEILLSAAWKRFAICLSMLFASEKNFEVCKVGGTQVSVVKNKVGKTTVDDSLRVLARQKVDRSVPSLKVLSGMLNAYYADFSSVDPSLHEYARGLEKVKEPLENDGWKVQLKAMTRLSIDSPVSHSSADARKLERYAEEERLRTNAEYMQSSLMQICKAMKIRVSRMSWKFFKMESGQVSLLLSAAEEVRSNLKCGRSRNATVLEDEKFDNEIEAGLVKLVLDLGLKRKYKFQAATKSGSSSQTTASLETHDTSEFDRSEGESETSTDDGATLNSPFMERIISLARERAGRWDFEIAHTMLDVSGIEEVNFEAEDTPKDLRAVSKLAVALRESVNRCSEAVEMLKEMGEKVRLPFDESSSLFIPCKYFPHISCALVSKEQATEHISIAQARDSFLADLALVFSGASEAGQVDPSYERMLSSIGIDVHDSGGWLNPTQVRYTNISSAYR